MYLKQAAALYTVVFNPLIYLPYILDLKLDKQVTTIFLTGFQETL